MCVCRVLYSLAVYSNAIIRNKEITVSDITTLFVGSLLARRVTKLLYSCIIEGLGKATPKFIVCGKYYGGGGI